LYQKTILPSGVTVVTEEIPHFHSVSLGIWIKTGSRDETAHENGMAHFLEHMAFKGTADRNAYELAREMDQLGGSSNAFTTKENTCFHGKVLADQLPRLVHLLSDIVLNPLYQADDLEKERQVILQEIYNIDDSPDDYIHELFSQNFWGDTPFGRPIMGTVEGVSGFARQDLLQYRGDNYQPERLVIAAAGRLNHQEFLDLISPHFGDLDRGRVVRPRAGVIAQSGEHFYSRDLEQVHLCFGTKAPAASDKTRFTAILLNLILGGSLSSRLFQEVREKQGLSYSIYSFFNSYSDNGLLGISAAASPANLSPLIETIKREIHKLKEEVVQEDELHAAQEHLRGSFYLSAEDIDNRMIRLAKNEINFGHYISYEEIISNLIEVTPPQIYELAQELLSLENWTMVFLGPVEDKC
jgi:predicted Zn-dependent peptidase